MRDERPHAHDWSDWSLFKPELLPPVQFVGDPYQVPKCEPLVAYRWRWCECGEAERQAYGSGKIERFDRDAIRAMERGEDSPCNVGLAPLYTH